MKKKEESAHRHAYIVKLIDIQDRRLDLYREEQKAFQDYLKGFVDDDEDPPELLARIGAWLHDRWCPPKANNTHDDILGWHNGD